LANHNFVAESSGTQTKKPSPAKPHVKTKLCPTLGKKSRSAEYRDLFAWSPGDGDDNEDVDENQDSSTSGKSNVQDTTHSDELLQ